MCFKILGNIMDVTGVTPVQKLILFVLADKQNAEFGYSWASINTLAKVCCCARTTIMANTAWLEKNNFISIKHSKDRKNTNRYTVIYKPKVVREND